MVTSDEYFLFEEHLDNIDNDNEGDDGVSMKVVLTIKRLTK